MENRCIGSLFLNSGSTTGALLFRGCYSQIHTLPLLREIHQELVKEYGGLPIVKNQGLLKPLLTTRFGDEFLRFCVLLAGSYLLSGLLPIRGSVQY